MINVKYANGHKEKVNSWELDTLIESRKIIAFQRRNEWAEIGKARLREQSIPADMLGRRSSTQLFPNKTSYKALAQKVIAITNENRLYKKAHNDLEKIIHESTDAITQLKFDGTISFWSQGAERMYGYSRDEAVGMNILQIIPKSGHAELVTFMTLLKQGERVAPFETQRLTKNSEILDVWLTATKMDSGPGDGEIATIERNITEKNRKDRENAQLIRELQKALSEIKTLTGFIPICSSCKDIRDGKGSWQQIESYIKGHTDAEFSHGICPKCAKRLYPDLAVVNIGE
jgi:PAS domain S-box-containing protein